MENILFTPSKIGPVSLRNRIVLPPMCQYSAGDMGLANPYHTAHYGVRALAGAALTILEATAVTADGRISGCDLGLWDDAHVEPLARLAETIAYFGSVPAVQLGHAGRKSWAGVDRLLAPSAVAFSPEHRVPEAMSISDIAEAIDAFAEATRRAVAAGYKVMELHGAHGYLIHQFISPLSNRRTDRYGGSRENRHRFLKETVAACQPHIGPDCALTVRVSASEYDANGYTLEDIIALCLELEAMGMAAIHVSSGGSVPVRPEVWPGYQLPLARAIKQSVAIPVIAVGLLGEPSLAEYALRNQDCDLVAVGRAYLHDAQWPVRAAKALEADLPIPEPMKKALLR
jgi:NADPH2 dehydrogenase